MNAGNDNHTILKIRTIRFITVFNVCNTHTSKHLRVRAQLDALMH